MKLTILQEDLAKALSLASRFINQKAQLPILGNVVFKAEKTKLNLLATNLELSLALSIGAKVEEEGEIAIPGRTVFEIISNLPKAQVTLESTKEQLKIKSDTFNGTLSGMNAADFPVITKSLGKNALTLDLKSFLPSLAKVAFSISVDETRPVLNGVLLMYRENKLILVATDGFRLSQKIIPVNQKMGFEKVILPKAVVGEVLRISETDSLLMEIKESESQVVFGFDNVILASRIISGTFPPFENIIPKSSATKVSVAKEDLIRAVKLASPFARDSANMVKFLVGKNSLKVLAESSKSGKEEGEVDAKVEGEEMEITFNFRFVEELLNVIDGEDVQIELTNTTSPGVFRDPKDKDFLHLIMPVRIQS